LAKNGSFQWYIYSHGNQLRISVFGNFGGREEKATIIKIQSKNTNCRNSAEKKRVTTTSQKQLIG